MFDAEDFDAENSPLDQPVLLQVRHQPLAPELLAALRLQEAVLNEACFGITNQRPTPQKGASL